MPRITRIILLFALIISAQLVRSQDFTLIMELMVTEDGKRRAGAEINVYRDGKFVEKVLTDAKGMADIPMKPNGIYSVEIGGNGDLIKKKLEVNTKNVPPEDLSGEVFFSPEVDLYKRLDGLDYSILNKPIGKIAYDPASLGFDADTKYTKEVKSQLEKLEDDYLKAKEEEAKNAANAGKLYAETIKLADKAFKAEQWEEAERLYKKAESLDPLETYPTFQLAELKTKLIKIRETNSRYDDAISKAEAAVKTKDFQMAIAEFKRASGYKPDEGYPQDQIKEIQTLLAKQAKDEQAYLAAIEKGDNALKASDFNTAKASFEEASAIKPEESYPKNKLAEITDVLAKREAKEQDYQNAIKAADDALAAKNYELSKSEYQKALGVKPAEKYPADQIVKVDDLLAKAAKLDQDYLAAIETADNALAAQDYNGAKSSYQSASQLKPDEEYPKNKIKEIDDFLAKQAAKDEEYQAKIKLGDGKLSSQEYEAAKTAYEEAISIKPTESYPKDKIKEIESALADIAAKEEQYKSAIAKADQALASEDFENAKAEYNVALGLKPNEQYPKDKLAEIDGIVVKLQEAEAAYKKAIQDGDDALADNNFEKAKEFYNQASSLKPEEQYPKDKLAEIAKKEQELADLENNYQASITAADQAFEGEDYETAKSEYQKALTFKADESHPQERINEIDKILADQAATEAEYQQAIASGDQALTANELENAKTAYEKALSIKPNESYPKDKISEIEAQLKALEEKEASYTAAIQKGDNAFSSEDWEAAKTAYQEALEIKDDEYPKGKIQEAEAKLSAIAAEAEAAAKLEADYQAAIAEGDQNVASKAYDEAIVSFEKASALKPDESYPKDKIEEIKAEQTKLAEEAKQAKIQAQYDSLISLADEAFDAENFEIAKGNYQAALGIKGNESHPQTRIGEIEKLLADAAALEENYKNAIAAADEAFSSQDWETAKSKYAEASSIKAEETYPKDKIKEIDEKLAELAAEQEEIRINQEAEAKLQADYDAAIKEADELFGNDQLDEAKAKYEAAIALKDEQYPKDKLSDIETRRAELASQAEAEAAAAAQAEIDAKYQGIIAEADALLASESFEEAKSKYQEALTVKKEAYPQDKINEIELKVADLAEQEQIRIKQENEAKIQAEYDAILTEADQLFGKDQLDEAKAKYEAALAVKDEQYPKDKLAEIESRRAELNAKAEQEAADAAQAEIDAQYQGIIAEADELFNSESYEEAKGKYQEAISVKSEAYPQDQITLIDNKLAELAAQAEKDAADAAQAEIDANYQSIIEEADQLFAANSFDEAKAKYEAAIAVKDEQYPKDQIQAIETKKAELAAQAEKDAADAEQAKLDAQYQGIIAEADQLVSNEALKEAKAKYQEALAVKDEQYPKDQISIIDNLLVEQATKAAEAELEADYQKAITEADALFNNSDWDNAISKYQEAFGLKQESYPQSQIELINQKKAELAEAAAREEAEKAKAQKEAAFQALIAEADALLGNNQLAEAKGKYEEALGVMESPYPAEQIAKIEEQLQLLAQKEAEAAKQAKLDADYQNAIKAGDEALSNKNYQAALSEYQTALSLKKEESYPAEKITEVNNLIAAENAANEEQQRRYEAAMREGETFLMEEAYEDAISSFERALELKPNESLPSQKITEARNAIAAAKAKEEEIRLRKEQAAQNEMAYQTAISNGDKFFRDKNYNEAENEYRLAKSLVPDKPYPQEQLDKIAALLKEKAEALQKARLKNSRYNELISSADEAYSKGNYLKAKSDYQAASGLKSDESYPKDQLVLVQQKLDEEAARKKEELKKLDEPIKIRTGPKATIDGDAEAKIDALYKKMWNQRNVGKNDMVEEKQDLIRKIGQEDTQEEEKAILEQKERIENISISLREQEQASSDSYMQNYDSVVEKEKAIKEEEEDNSRDAKKEREDEMAEKERLLEDLKTQEEGRANRIVEGKKSKIENEYEEVKISREYRYDKQGERTSEEQQKAEDVLVEVKEFNSTRNKEIVEESTPKVESKKEAWKETVEDYSDDLTNRIEEEDEEIVDKRAALREIEQAKQGSSFKAGQATAEKQHEDQKEFEEKKMESSTDKILDEQSNINDKELAKKQFQESRSDHFKDNQEAIEQKRTDLKEESEALNAEAEKRRQDNKDPQFYDGEDKPRQDPESADYPQGVTEKIIENSNGSTTIRRIVVEGTQTDVYEKTLYTWGGIFYTKNGANITKEIWDKESR